MINDIDLYNEYKKCMSELESKFDNNKLATLRDMIDLYGKLKDTYFHDIADSIELWIDGYPKKELLDYLKNKEDNYYNTLIDVINSK
jgi:hypothetical protein